MQDDPEGQGRVDSRLDEGRGRGLDGRSRGGVHSERGIIVNIVYYIILTPSVRDCRMVLEIS